jgi:hypothetical protein
LAVTQFQPTHARRALPCFDEPHLKAEFAISVTAPGNMKALSNAIEESEIIDRLVLKKNSPADYWHAKTFQKWLENDSLQVVPKDVYLSCCHRCL